MDVPRLEHHHRHADAIIEAALAAAAPGPAVVAAWGRVTQAPTTGFGLVAVGKAAIPMTEALIGTVHATPEFGTLIHPAGPSASIDDFPAAAMLSRHASDHPIPTERSLSAGLSAIATADKCRHESRPLVVLLSGGASSLMCVPCHGLTTADIAACTDALLRAGAPSSISTLFALSATRRRARVSPGWPTPSPVLTFILSDVIGDKFPVIGSGPTVAPVVGPVEALDILRRYKLGTAHTAIAAHLRLLATMWHRPRFKSANARHFIIANNATAVAAAARQARALGFAPAPTRADVIGEARDAAFDFVSALRRARAQSTPNPVALIWGGETTVSVQGAGRGGRNQEAVLAAAIALDNDPTLVVATFATDGVDGPTDAAGAIVTGRTAAEARQAGVDPEDALARSDSHTFFTKRGGHLKPGPTGTNVNDVWIGLAY